MTQDRPGVDGHLRFALDGVEMGLWEWDLDADTLFWDETCERLFGYESGEFPGTYQAFTSRILGDDRDTVDARLTTAIETSGQYQVEFRIEPPDDERRWIRSRGRVEADDAGEPSRLVGTHRDVTDQRTSRRELESYRQLFEKTTDCVVEIELVDNESLITRVNAAFEETFGYTESAVRGENIHDLLTPEEHRAEAMQIREAYEAGNQPVVEVTRNTADGQREFLMRAVNFSDRYYYVIYTDITERKEYEQELETLNRRFQLALEETDTGVWEWDLDTDEVIWDEATERLFGYDPGEFPGTFESIAARTHDDDIPDLRTAIDTALETGNEYRADFRVDPPDGDQRWVQTRGVVETDESGMPTRMFGIQTDITERKESERAIEKARAELRQVIDLIPDPIFAKNREDELLLSNEANAELLGSTPEDIEGKPEPQVMPDVDNYETFRQRDIDVIESGESTVFEESLTGAGGEKQIFQTTRIPFETAKTAEKAVLGYARDVTELKEYEQELEAQRDNLDVLNQVVRHDIRNNLQLVVTYAELLEPHVEPEGEEYVEQVLESANNAIDITTTARDVTAVMVKSAAETRPTPLRSALAQEIDDVRTSNQRALVTLDGPIPDVDVVADDMLAAVFRNLLTNAIVHNDKEVPEISVGVETADDSVAVSVADNGPGIPDERKRQIFAEGEMGLESGGTGLGLYLVETLVDRYGGEIDVRDNEPGGAIFVVQLPIAG
jgi:PAS domain S-box-containing protein